MPLSDALPAHTLPRHYDITLTPDEVTFRFDGRVVIEVESVEASGSVVLNCKDIDISAIKIDGVAAASHSIDDKLEHLTIVLPDAVKFEGKGEMHKVDIEFKGTHNDQMCGFYRSTYKDIDGEDKVMLVTQFESVDARRAFPCFDEPIRKATFSSTLIVRDGLTALSNMPVAEETLVEVAGRDCPMRRFAFERTPLMSTYLVAYAVGELECGETVTKSGIPVRIYAQRGKSSEGLFALNVCKDSLDYLGEYFAHGYPLPKLDMVSVPDFSAGAMENFGLVTYREVLLLVRDDTPAFLRQRVAYVVAHENSHQWFGNTVTFKEWMDLWCNEGFATQFGFEAANDAFPEWRLRDQFIINEFARGLQLDALRSSHPIRVEIEKSRDIDDVFDAISYSKGASVIRMLEAAVGEQVLREGMRIYIKRHAHANADTSDIWAAVSEAAGGRDIAAMMGPFVTQVGFPLVTVSPSASGDGYTLTQDRFLADGSKDTDAATWVIPVRCAVYNGTEANPMTVTDQFFSGREATLELPAGGSFFKINHGETGFYRVHYAPEIVAKMDIGRLPVTDRAMLVSNAHALASAGRIGVAEALGLLARFKDESDYVVWKVIIDLVQDVASVFGGALNNEDGTQGKASEALSGFIRGLLSATTARLGWDETRGEPSLDALLRAMVIPVSARHGDANVLAEARKRFAAGTVPNNLLGGVLGALVRDDHATHLPSVLSLHDTTTAQDVRLACLGSLGDPRDASTVAEMLSLALNGDHGVRAQDAFYVFVSASSHPVGRSACWSFVRENWDALKSKFSAGMGLLARCAAAPVGKMTADADADEAERFFRENPGEGIDRSIAQAVETARARAAWVKRDAEGLRAFLESL